MQDSQTVASHLNRIHSLLSVILLEIPSRQEAPKKKSLLPAPNHRSRFFAMGCGPSTCSHYAIVNDNRSNLLKVTKYPVYGPDAIMNRKRHGTSDVPVQEDLRWNIPRDVADQICNFNLGVAENPGTLSSSSIDGPH